MSNVRNEVESLIETEDRITNLENEIKKTIHQVKDSLEGLDELKKNALRLNATVAIVQDEIERVSKASESSLSTGALKAKEEKNRLREEIKRLKEMVEKIEENTKKNGRKRRRLARFIFKPITKLRISITKAR